jgi:uncharacterized protein
VKPEASTQDSTDASTDASTDEGTEKSTDTSTDTSTDEKIEAGTGAGADEVIDALQTVCDRLGGFDDRVSLEWLDGALTALLAGPRVREPQDWLPRLFGDTWERTFADPEDHAQALAAVTARCAEIGRQLDPERLFDDPDALQLSPLMVVIGPEQRQKLLDDGDATAEDLARLPATGEVWAQGFLDAVEALADDWVSPAPGDEDAAWFDSSIRAVLALTIADEAELKADLAARYPGKTLDRDDLIDEACFAAQDLRCYWVDHAPRHAPRRVQAPPGRNEPCPCGSGRKYKKCHGAA